MEPVHIWWRKPWASVHQRGPLPKSACPTRWTFGFWYMPLDSSDVYPDVNFSCMPSARIERRAKKLRVHRRSPYVLRPSKSQDCNWYLVPTSLTGEPEVLPRSKYSYDLCIQWLNVLNGVLGDSAPWSIEAVSVLHEHLEWLTDWLTDFLELFVCYPAYVFIFQLFQGNWTYGPVHSTILPYRLLCIFYCLPCTFRLVISRVHVIIDANCCWCIHRSNTINNTNFYYIFRACPMYVLYMYSFVAVIDLYDWWYSFLYRRVDCYLMWPCSWMGGILWTEEMINPRTLHIPNPMECSRGP